MTMTLRYSHLTQEHKKKAANLLNSLSSVISWSYTPGENQTSNAEAQRVTLGVGLPELMIAFIHSMQRQTLDYLCVQPEEIKNIYQNEL